MKPVSVTVQWSESDSFAFFLRRPLDFTEFELRARSAAHKKGSGRGYDKTSVLVLFDDGTQYECRLDLAEDDCHGFRHHIERQLAFSETEKGHALGQNNPDWARLLRIWRLMDFDR